ncbi:MAG: hypothetical protein K8M05_10405 [Deltaproteobacteria bacterium]|nr:hypothetical protein [Kofleriaceae bacterium]
MSRNLEPEDVRAFWKFMQDHYGTSVIAKDDATSMKAIATLLEALGVMDREIFLRDYTTTIGKKIYTPFEVGVAQPGWDLWQQIVVCVHEHQHVVQHVRDGLAYEAGYLADTSTRARHEAEAYLTNIELHHWRYGVIPTPRRFAEKLAHYACKDQDIAWAAKYLTLVAETVRMGGAVTEAGAVALDWLDEHLPELAHSDEPPSA